MAESRANGRKNFLKEKIFVIALVLLLLLALFSYPIAKAAAYNKLSAVLVMDGETGAVLYQENAEERVEIASTTKILTAITVIEHGDIFMEAKIPEIAVGVEGSSVYLRKGEKWRVLDLLYGLMLRSGNDAAVALAVITSGSLEKFVSLMNETARKIGAEKSNFVNPHGLHDKEHYSTALDLAKITAYALKCPIFAEICRTKTHRCEKEVNGERERVIFYNKNKLLYSDPSATGVKTGYTTHSGRCLVSSAERNERRLICVTINVYDTYGVTKTLFDRYFNEGA